jgi:hypothetical protein
MLKTSVSGVLASLRSSTGTRPPHHSAARTDLVLLIRRTVRPRGYASGSSLAAALLNGLFEHPAGLVFYSYPRLAGLCSSAVAKWYFRSHLVCDRRHDDDVLVLQIDGRRLSIAQFALDQLTRHRRFNLLLDQSLQRSRPIDRIVATLTQIP